MRRISLLLVISCLGCDDPKTPVSPTFPTPSVQFSVAGQAHDTATRPLADVRIEVVDGARAGEVVISNAQGRFVFPGSFADAVSLRATKDGYESETKRVQTSYSGPNYVDFAMILTRPTADITGEYLVTFTADASCSVVPAAARTRSYTATIRPSGFVPHGYSAVLGDAKFFPSTYNDRLFINVAGDFARFYLDPSDDGTSIAEELEPSAYVAIWGAADLSVSGSTLSGSMNGAFAYCVNPVVPAQFFRCASQPPSCPSPNHRVTLVRR